MFRKVCHTLRSRQVHITVKKVSLGLQIMTNMKALSKLSTKFKSFLNAHAHANEYQEFDIIYR